MTKDQWELIKQALIRMESRNDQQIRSLDRKVTAGLRTKEHAAKILHNLLFKQRMVRKTIDDVLITLKSL